MQNVSDNLSKGLSKSRNKCTAIIRVRSNKYFVPISEQITNLLFFLQMFTIGANLHFKKNQNFEVR